MLNESFSNNLKNIKASKVIADYQEQLIKYLFNRLIKETHLEKEIILKEYKNLIYKFDNDDKYLFQTNNGTGHLIRTNSEEQDEGLLLKFLGQNLHVKYKLGDITRLKRSEFVYDCSLITLEQLVSKIVSRINTYNIEPKRHYKDLENYDYNKSEYEELEEPKVKFSQILDHEIKRMKNFLEVKGFSLKNWSNIEISKDDNGRKNISYLSEYMIAQKELSGEVFDNFRRNLEQKRINVQSFYSFDLIFLKNIIRKLYVNIKNINSNMTDVGISNNHIEIRLVNTDTIRQYSSPLNVLSSSDIDNILEEEIAKKEELEIQTYGTKFTENMFMIKIKEIIFNSIFK